MDLDALTSSIHSLSLDTETTTTTSLSDKTDIINKASAKILEFNKFNETKFHFSKPKFEPNPIGKLLLKFLKCSLTYLDQVEKFECPEAYTLTDSYYLLACNCLNSIRILSRDTDVIESFTVDDLLDLVQQAADLKNLTINNKDCQFQSDSIKEPSFIGKEKLTFSEAEIVLKTRERSELILAALKAMSNLIYNNKSIQEFYAENQLAVNISIYLKNLLTTVKPPDPVYISPAEANIILFKLKILFLLTVFTKETRQALHKELDVLDDCRQFLALLNLKEEQDCCLATEVLKIAYNLTMDIEAVRSQAREALASVKPPDGAFVKTPNSTELNTKDEAQLQILVDTLKVIICSDEVSYTKKSELISNSINLLTNMPSICFQNLIPVTTTETQDEYVYEDRDMKAISAILGFMGDNMPLYVSLKISADTLYPCLMLLSVMSKTNRTIRRYLKSVVLPPLTESDLVNLPQHGKTNRNLLVRLMTDPNLQLKRLCAQFLFILCKENVGRLIKYTGYGNAAGMLAEAGLMLSTHGDSVAYSSESENSDSEEYQKLEKDINVITGQAEVENSKLLNENERLAKEMRKKRQEMFDGMSEEQKEYEAMQLVNAIDKLTKMGSLGSGLIKPATIGPDGRPVEMESVLQLQESTELKKH